MALELLNSFAQRPKRDTAKVAQVGAVVDKWSGELDAGAQMRMALLIGTLRFTATAVAALSC